MPGPCSRVAALPLPLLLLPQVVVAHRRARLLPLWLALYREYRPAMWYYNAGEAPTR